MAILRVATMRVAHEDDPSDWDAVSPVYACGQRSIKQIHARGRMFNSWGSRVFVGLVNVMKRVLERRLSWSLTPVDQGTAVQGVEAGVLGVERGCTVVVVVIVLVSP